MFAYPINRKFSIGLLALAIAFAAFATTASAQTASGQTTNELLEKAVYAEETSGDLKKAIGLYSQVIAKGKRASQVAAEAQYRLGLCLEKQNKETEARAAFQAVVDNYPKIAKFVSLAKKHLPGSLKLTPVPWSEHQQMHMEMKLANGRSIGKVIYGIDAAEFNGKPVWRCATRLFVALNDANSFSEVFCDKETFAPLESYWGHSILGKADAKYETGKVAIDLSSRDTPLILDFTVPGYDNEQGVQVFRRLPLEVGFKSELTIIATLSSTVIPLGLEVTKKETITVPAGTFDCFKMELNIGQTFWIADNDDRTLVRFAAGGITADLTHIETRKPDEAKEISNKEFDITLPGSWFVYAPKTKKDHRRMAYLLDPRGLTTAEFAIHQKDKLDDKQKASPQAWMEAKLKRVGEHLQDFKIRPESFGKMQLKDQEATTIVFDYIKNDKPRTGYGVTVFGDKTAAGLWASAPADQFEEMRKEFNVLVRSLHVK